MPIFRHIFRKIPWADLEKSSILLILSPKNVFTAFWAWQEFFSNKGFHHFYCCLPNPNFKEKIKENNELILRKRYYKVTEQQMDKANFITKPNLEIKTTTDTVQKEPFLLKKGTSNFTNPYSKSLLNVLHQNKRLYNFHEREQDPKTGCCFFLN